MRLQNAAGLAHRLDAIVHRLRVPVCKMPLVAAFGLHAPPQAG